MRPGWKVVFEKWGKLKPSRKINTQFWNHFNQIKIHAWSTSQNTIFEKWYYFNTVKIISVENQSNHKTMPSTFLYYGPSTTSHVQRSVLRWPCAGLRAIHQRCKNSPPHKSYDILVRLGLQTFHRRCDIMHLLVSKTPCSAYVSQDVSKNGHLTQIKFSRKTY